MKRDATDAIIAWNSDSLRKPLILMGARQVGKSWLMSDFAKTAYPNDTVAVNFMENAAGLVYGYKRTVMYKRT